MNREDIIRMAREAGAMVLLKSPDRTHVDYQMSPESVERLSALVAAAEREACAKVCDTMATPATSREAQLDFHWAAGCCAAAIRARSNT